MIRIRFCQPLFIVVCLCRFVCNDPYLSLFVLYLRISELQDILWSERKSGGQRRLLLCSFSRRWLTSNLAWVFVVAPVACEGLGLGGILSLALSSLFLPLSSLFLRLPFDSSSSVDNVSDVFARDPLCVHRVILFRESVCAFWVDSGLMQAWPPRLKRAEPPPRAWVVNLLGWDGGINDRMFEKWEENCPILGLGLSASVSWFVCLCLLVLSTSVS